MKNLINISNLISLISCSNGSIFGTFNSRRGTDTGSGIVEITIELNKKETLVLERDLKNLGYKVFKKDSFVELKGPEICLKIKKTDKNYRGIIQIKFILNRSIIEKKKIVMGKSILSFDRYNMATWDFFDTTSHDP